MELHLFFRTPYRFSVGKFYGALTLLLFILTATIFSLQAQTLIGPSELLANTESSYYISDPSVTGNWEVNGSATVSSNLVNQNAIKVKANNLCIGRFTVIVKIGDKYLFRQVDIIKNLPPIFTSGASTATLSCNSTLEDFNKYKPTAKDIDGNAVEVVMKDMVPMQMGRCMSIVTWEATDRCGNKATFTQSIEIVGNKVDTEAPVFDQTTLVKTFYDCDKIPRTFPVPKATDNCVNPVMVKLVRREVSERIRSSIACMSYFEILTWEATDVCGNKTQADQTICIVDNVPPVFVSSTLAPITVNQCGFNYDLYQPKATDNCSNPVMIMAVNFQSTTTGVGQRTVVITWEATDMCGNATRAKQTFNVIDETPPRINRGLPLPNINIECSDDLNKIRIPLGFDDCGDPVEVIFASRRIIVAGNCNGIIEITWKATDASGNMSFATQIVNINDKTRPVITCPAGMTVSCASDVPAPNIAAVAATDNCDDNVAIAFVNDVISNQTCANRYTITRTYRGTDDCGNSATCTQTIRVNDQTRPIITCPGTITVSCANLVPAPNIALPTATDNCGGNVVISHVGDAAVGGQCANRFRITRTYMATDLCGNTATCTQTIIVDDQTPPMIACPANRTISCAGDVPAPDINAVTATDNCGGNVTVTHVGDVTVPGTCVNRFTINRTYRATDICGNTATCTQVITVNDNVPPTLNCPGPLTVSCAGNVPAPNTALVTGVSDNCPGVVTVTFVGDVNSNQTCTNRLTITRTYRATDVCGNTATCTQIITVNDQTPPSLTCPGAVTVSCANQVPAPNITSVTGVSDNCGGMVTVTHVGDVISNQTCVNRFTITRTYRATDVCGNSATCTQIITVFDNIVPMITCPAPVTVSCAGGNVPAPNPASVVATDNCGGNVVVTHVGDAAVGGQCANSFRITRTYKATDACGNTATCTQIITVDDQTPPNITCPGPVTVACAGDVPAPNISLVIATDGCGGIVTVIHVGDVITRGTCVNRFTITRTYRATDVCGNSATCTQLITVNDNIPPTLTCPGPLTVSCAGNVPAPNIALVTGVSDNCPGAVTVTFVGDVNSNQTCTNRLTITRTYRATDVCGNTATCTQIITVNDQTPPSLTCPANLIVQCANQVPAPNTTSVIGLSDNCGGIVTVTHVGDVISNQTCANRFTITRTYRATDVCGNSATCTHTITVNDQTAPVLVGLPTNLNITVGCNSIPPVPNVTATDNCGNAMVTFNEVRNPGACLRTITRTWFATDACGNVSATVTQTINVTEQFTVNFTQRDIDGLISPSSVCCEADAIARLRAANINLIVTVCGVAIPVAPTLCVDMNGCSNGNRGSTYRVFFSWQLASPCNPNVILVDLQSKFVNINPNSANCPPCGSIRMCDPNGGIRCDNIIPLQAPNLSNKKVDIVKDKANDISLTEGFKFNNYSDGIKVKDFKVSASPNPTTGDINFSITAPIKGDLRLKLYDASGKQIGLIVRQDLEGGFENQIKYNIPANVSNGLIFYTVTVGEEVKSGKLMYMKN